MVIKIPNIDIGIISNNQNVLFRNKSNIELLRGT